MAITRTIYTQGEVTIAEVVSGDVWTAHGVTGGYSTIVSGVQSASFNASESKQDVNVFGERGSVKRVQLEPSRATMEVSAVVCQTGVFPAIDNWLKGMIDDALSDQPKGVTVTAKGVGTVQKAILSSINLEASVGALPQITLSFEGFSGTHPAGDTAPTQVTALTLDVVTPENFGTIYWNTAIGDEESGCIQTVRAAWEVGTETINCLGNNINSGTIFSTPPGTLTLTAEGVEHVVASGGQFLTGVKIGDFFLGDARAELNSVTANMAVGESFTTYNVESVGTALGTVSTD